MDKSFEIKGYINNVLKETGLEGADAFDKALFLLIQIGRAHV